MELIKTIVVADRGLNTSDNIFFLAGKNDDKSNKDGYVYGQSVISSDKEFKDWVLNQNGYTTDIFTEDSEEIHFKHKSRIYAKLFKLKEMAKGQTNILFTKNKWFIFQQKYADKQNVNVI